MKKFLLNVFLLVCMIFIVNGCALLQMSFNNLSHNCGDAYLNLTKDLDQISYWPRQYKENVFDCSNMSALLFDALSKKGYKCDLVIGWTFWSMFFNNSSNCHVWVIVKKKDCEFWIEPTAKAIIPPNFYRKYFFRYYFHSIKIAKDVSKRKFGWSEKEWEY